MPQAVPKSVKDYTVHVGPMPFEKQPGLCLAGMRIITQYVLFETVLLRLFLTLLGSNPGPAIAFYSAIKNTNVRNEGFRSVAASVLSDEDQEILEAIFKQCGRADDERNRIAHWLWGYSPNFPDAVVLVDPRKMADVSAKMRVVGDQGSHTPDDAEEVVNRIRGASLVFRQADFNYVRKQIDEAINLVSGFERMLPKKSQPKPNDEERSALLASPVVAEWLARRKEKPQEAP